MLKRLHALWLLGSAMVLVVFRRVFLRRDPIRRFEEFYAEEGSLPLSLSESSGLQRENHCTGCGRCDVDGSGRLVQFILAGTRSLPDADAAYALVSELNVETLSLAEAKCPEGVPIAHFVELVRDHSKRRLELVQSLHR